MRRHGGLSTMFCNGDVSSSLRSVQPQELGAGVKGLGVWKVLTTAVCPLRKSGSTGNHPEIGHLFLPWMSPSHLLRLCILGWSNQERNVTVNMSEEDGSKGWSPLPISDPIDRVHALSWKRKVYLNQTSRSIISGTRSQKSLDFNPLSISNITLLTPA